MHSPWPLADGRGNVDDPWRVEVADRLERMLQEHVVAPWFPRVVDRQRGGYLTDFDRAWRHVGSDERMLEYQARQMRTAARLGRAVPSDSRWADMARHGMRYINDVMRDGRDGGWFWLVGRDGAPLASGTKTAHSAAYVITGMAEVYGLTGDEEALSTAQEAFRWLDATLHDDEHGGYHGWATRDGRPILDASQATDWPRDTDPLGHDIGLKDANVHSDLLESLRLLYAARPTELLRERLLEVLRIVLDHFIDDRDRLHYLLRPDLTPVEGPFHPGYAFQCSQRIPLAEWALGETTDAHRAVAGRILAWGLAAATSSRGGVVETDAGPKANRRTWWVQTEALMAMTMMEALGQGSYRDRIRAHLRLIETQYVDARHGGWFETARADWTIRQRAFGRRLLKAHRWKDASHETDAALLCIRVLRGLPPDSALTHAAAHESSIS